MIRHDYISNMDSYCSGINKIKINLWAQESVYVTFINIKV